MQSCSQIVIFVATVNEGCTCQTDILGGSYWLINLFAAEQDYFVYAELLVSQFSERKGRKEGIGRKETTENHMRTLADSYPHCNEPPTFASGAGKAGCPREGSIPRFQGCR